MKTIGIVAHSAEGAALCFLSACHQGAIHLEPHMHPTIVLSAIPMGLSMAAWESDDYQSVGRILADGVQQVADAGAGFFICPDNTAHIALEQVADGLPLPGLHIAHVVCHQAVVQGWQQIGLLGTRWTMSGSVYPTAMEKHGLEYLVPDDAMQDRLNTAIFDELCQGVFELATTGMFIRAIDDLRARGAQAVILGCTEIPLIVTPENSPLPVLDSTRLLAESAVREALSEQPITVATGWLDPRDALD